MKGIFAGIVAGVIGALAWAVIAAFTGYEIGWLAWGIGAGVGAAVAWGNAGSKANGIIAVIIAVVAILGGKLASVEISIAKEVKYANAEIKTAIDKNDEFLLIWLADTVVADLMDKGLEIKWPDGITAETAGSKKDYPVEIWVIAEQAWAEMSEEDKGSFKSDVEKQIAANIKLFSSEVRGEGFFSSFGVFDIVFFFLAISTAFKIASKEDGQVAVESKTDVEGVDALNKEWE